MSCDGLRISKFAGHLVADWTQTKCKYWPFSQSCYLPPADRKAVARSNDLFTINIEAELVGNCTTLWCDEQKRETDQ